MVVVESIAVTDKKNKRRVSCAVSDGLQERVLWYEVEGVPVDVAFDSADAFFGPCLLLAIKNDKDIHYKVPISESIAGHAEDIGFIIASQLGKSKSPKVYIEDVCNLKRVAQGGVAGFSSGVDSWYTLKQWRLCYRYQAKKISHLVVNNVGAVNTSSKLESICDRAKAVCEDFGLGFVRVHSNMEEFLRMNFQRTHTVRNAAAAHLFTPIADTFYYSASEAYGDFGVFEADAMGYADPILLPLLSSDAMDLKSSGAGASRAEKTREIIDIPGVGNRLDICVRSSYKGPKINCGTCWKCIRTGLVLEALGALEKFENCFDIDAYKRNMTAYVASIAGTRRPNEREAFEIARRAGLVWPPLLYKPRQFAQKISKTLKISSFVPKESKK